MSNRWAFPLAVLLAGVFSSAIFAADSPFIVDSWNNREGLPQSSVLSVIQTKDGYLWLGTFNGLVRFDGSRFTVFDANNTPDLNSGRIVCLFEDSHTNLWIGTDTAAVMLVRDGKSQNFYIGRSGHEGRLMSVCEDAGGGIWLYTADARLGHYQNGKMEVVPFPFGPLAICRLVVAEKNGPIWIGEFSATKNGPFCEMFAIQPDNFHPPAIGIDQFIPAQRLDFLLASRRGGTWRLINGRVQKWNTGQLEKDFGLYPWTNVAVSSACEDKDGNLIVGTGDGVFWFDADGKYHHISTEQGLSSAFVLSLCMDREGNLWVGTDGGGLNRVKRKIFQAPEGARTGVVQSVSQDATGGLWMAFNGAGASYWITNSAQDFATIGRYPNAWTVLADSKQQVWVGTRDEGLFQFQTNHFERAPGSEILNGQIFALFEDHSGRIWAGAQNGLARWDGKDWKMLTMRDGLSENIVRAIAEDGDGNLWIGTEGGGLNFFKDGKFISYRKQNGLPGDDISSLYTDKNGVLWVGTAEHGLASFFKGKWTRYSKGDGLASDSIDYIVEDIAGDLWIGSNEGLTRIQKKSADVISCRTFTETDGLPTRECSAGAQPAALCTHDGRLWFPTVKGLVWVNPAELKPNLQAPLVLIESVRIDGREQKTNPFSSVWTQSIVIPPGHEQLEIDYTALNFSAPREVHFKYRLEGRDTAWTSGDTRVADYPNLPHGHYYFHVQACNEDGLWNEAGSVLEITVQPQFWQTPWFRAAAIIFILGIVAAFVRYISTQKLRRELQLFKQHEALERERGRIARDLHDQLGANLTQVALLGEMAEADKNSPDEIESHAQQISQTARETTRSLDEIVWAVNPSNDTLEGLANYACKYAQEYLALAGLRYRVDLPVQLPPAPIPPEVRHNVFLAFKEAVHNVVKHAQASEAWIRLHLQPEHFTLEIEDNGRGIGNQAAPQNRSGLRNMRKRMEDIDGEFSISGGASGGTIVRLTVPLSKLS
jgi:ligand-binding sensor domain-containing protein/signal transduction histidine kinase